MKSEQKYVQISFFQKKRKIEIVSLMKILNNYLYFEVLSLEYL